MEGAAAGQAPAAPGALWAGPRPSAHFPDVETEAHGGKEAGSPAGWGGDGVRGPPGVQASAGRLARGEEVLQGEDPP